MPGLRLGLLGAGRWGKAYIRTIAALDGANLAAVASANPETASLVPPGCLIERDWRAVVASPRVDAIIIATPPALHHDMAREALLAGKPVLVEKPFTLDVRQAEELAALAERRGLALMVEHTHLFAPAFRALAARVPTLGGIRSIRGRGNADGPVRADVPVLWDWGSHDVSMCVDLLGRPAQQSARRLERRAGIANAERVAIALAWSGSVAADIEVSNISVPKRRQFEVECRNGSLLYDDLAPVKLTETGRDGIVKPIAVPSDMPLTAAVSTFVGAASRPPDPAGLALACDVVRVLAACDQSLVERC